MKTPKIHCIFLLVLTLLAFGSKVGAQTVTIGTGTTGSSSYPIYTFSNYSATECIYLGSEMNNTTGMVKKIAYYKTQGTSTITPAIKIYMKTTTQIGVNSGSSSSYSVGTTAFGEYTLVYDGTLPNGSATGWMEVTLNTPFYYSSTSQNLSVLVTSSTYIDSGRPNYQITSTGSPYRRSAYNGSTAWSTTTSMSTGTDRPNIRFTLEAPVACSGTPVPGNTVSTASSVCPATSFTLSLQNATSGTGVSYQWQSSVNNTTWNNISSATSSTLATTQTASTYYRCNVTCSGNTGTSNAVQVTMSNTIPFFEGFESGQSNNTAVAGCWSQQSVSGSATWMANNSLTDYNRSPRSGSWNAYLAYSNEDWLFYALPLTGGTAYQMEFYARQDVTSGATVTAAYGTSATATAMTNTIVAGTAVTNGSYQKFSGIFTPSSTGTYYIGIKATLTSAPYYLSIDDIKVDVLPNCSAATFPTSVTASASKTGICSSEALTFSLGSGIPSASGITYQWKSSADGVTYTNVGTASTTATATLTADANNKYFKCDVLCNGSTVLTSTPVAVSLGVSITGTTPGSRCGQGTVQLGATTESGNSIKWYTAETSGTLIGTGATVTTPEIAHTTTYYAAAVGAQTISAAGANNPQALGSLGSTNNAVETYFTVASATSLTSVTVYPLDAGTNNKIILKNSSGTVLQEYTFTITSAEANSTNSSMGSPKVVTLNWDLPAGSYKLQWDNPGGAGANRVLRNLGGASAYYNTNYSGVTFTGNSGSGTSYWFYFYDWKFTTGCGESATRVPVTATVNYEWTGAADSNWHNPANWCGGSLPGVEDNITFPQWAPAAEIQAGNTGYAKSLALAEATSLNVKTGATLWVANGLSVDEDATLTVQDNAALVQVNTAANTGNITLHKKSNPLYRLDYTLWSSPVDGQSLGDFSPATSSNRYYEYKYNEGVEAYWPVSATDSFTAAKGYLIRMPNVLAANVPGNTNDGVTTPAEYIAGSDNYYFDGVFTGAPHNGTVTYPLSIQGGLYTAVGNPYPSPINIYDFFYGDIDAATAEVQSNSSVIDIASGIYLWRKRNNSSNPSYATINLSGFVQNPADGGGSEQGCFFTGGNTGWTLAPGQGFIVKAKSGTTNPLLTFTNSMRRAAGGTSQSFFKSAANTASRLWLNITGDTAASQAMVGYFAQGTTGIDYGYDAVKFTDANTIALYSIAEATPLAIQARAGFETTDVVPMGFTAPVAGTYTINLDHVDGVFAQGQKIYLRDNTEGLLRDLTQQEYTFSAEAGTFENRFEVVYATQSLGTDNPLAEANNIIVFTEGKTISISSGNTMMDSINVFDIRGRRLYTQGNINSNRLTISNLDAAQQVLIVEVYTAKGKVSRRILF